MFQNKPESGVDSQSENCDSAHLFFSVCTKSRKVGKTRRTFCFSLGSTPNVGK